LSYLCWRAWEHKNARPRWSQEWVPSWNCLTNVRASDSDMTPWPSVHFHYPSSVKYYPSVSNPDYCCDICSGSHSDKGHRNKAAAYEAVIWPPVRTSCLAFLSAFWFSQTAIVSPFWYPQQYITATG
jgi:hypothetical protein